ncbi:MAG: 6-pyruvoyl-tetrahydropterin synthase-related protein [Acidobacteriaceae bacterium]
MKFPPFRYLLIACTALLATGTLIVRGNSCGHDFDFHLLSWMEVARAWHTGLLYPHWVQDANYGAGEPRLIFYPPASWALGGLLGIICGWYAAPVLFVLLALAAAGAAMYRLAREWAGPEAATFAACLYIANPYVMFAAYERSALGEVLAAAWFPWMVLFALRTRSSMAALGLSVGALWLTNAPAAVVGSYLLALLAVAMWVAEGRPRTALRAAGGMILGLGLAAFYIVPAIVQQRWVQIERAINPGMRVEDSFLFGHTADAFHDQVLHKASWIFVAEMAFATIAAYLAWRKRADGAARVSLSVCLPVILLLQLPLSEAIWKYTPHMKFLQFPWRWLLALNVAMCVLAAMAVERPGDTSSAAISGPWRSTRGSAHPPLNLSGGSAPGVTPGFTMTAAALIAALAIGGGLLFFQPCDDEDAVVAQIAGFRLGTGTGGTDEYTPRRADNALVQQHLPLVRIVRGAQDDEASEAEGANPEWQAGGPGSLQAKVEAKRQNVEHWRVSVSTPEGGYAVFRLMDFPSWRVTVDGKPSPVRPMRKDGLLAVPIGAGSHDIRVEWIATWDVIAGTAISVIALLAVAGVAIKERRERQV